MTDSRAMVDAAVRESAIFPVATRRVVKCSREAKTAPLRRGRTYSLAHRHSPVAEHIAGRADMIILKGFVRFGGGRSASAFYKRRN